MDSKETSWAQQALAVGATFLLALTINKCSDASMQQRPQEDPFSHHPVIGK